MAQTGRRTLNGVDVLAGPFQHKQSSVLHLPIESAISLLAYPVCLITVVLYDLENERSLLLRSD